MTNRHFSLIAGVSYLVIFFAAIFANFFVLDTIIKNPLETVSESSLIVRLGIMAFLITAVFDVIVAWALYEMYKKHHFTLVSTFFRIIHAVIMGVAVFALPLVFYADTAEAILYQVNMFNTIWLIGLFFFGVHLIFLARIVKEIKIIPYMLMAAGVMYIIDTGAHFTLANYADYADIFLTLVAIPSIFGEMAFSIWLLARGGRNTV